MTLNEYQAKALSTSLLDEINDNSIMEAIFGLVEEAGEVAGKAKRVLRDGKTFIDYQEDLKGELGDVAWYLAVLAFRLGISLEDVCQANVQKLHDRMNRGQIQGSGDKR